MKTTTIITFLTAIVTLTHTSCAVTHASGIGSTTSNQHHLTLAERLSHDIVHHLDHRDGGGRKLQMTASEFETFCESWIKETNDEREGKCNCDSSSYSIVCKEDQEECAFAFYGCPDMVCDTFTYTVSWDKFGNLVYKEWVSEYRGDDVEYDKERVRITGSTCEWYFTRDGQEYRCAECKLCDNFPTTQAVNLDCSNIQPGATADCDYDRDLDGEYFDICSSEPGSSVNGSGADPTSTRSKLLGLVAATAFFTL